MQKRLALLDRRAVILVLMLGVEALCQTCLPWAKSASDGMEIPISGQGLAALGTLFIVKISLATAALVFIAIGLVQVIPTPWGPSVHQPFMLARGSWRIRDKKQRIEELAARFEESPGSPGSAYDESLLRDLDHLAQCVCWKRVCLCLASMGVLGAVGVGLAGAIIRVVLES